MKSLRITLLLLANFAFFNLVAQKELVKAEKYYAFTETGSESVSTKDAADYYAVFSHHYESEWSKEGKYEEFYIDGSKKELGNFITGIREGIWKKWYQSGQRESEKNYIYNAQEKTSVRYLTNFWDRDGKQLVTDGNGYYTYKYENGNTEWEGNYKNGIAIGVWKKHLRDGTLRHREIWAENDATGFTFLNSAEKSEYQMDSVYYETTQKNAEPKGGLEAFYKYISKKLKYPKEAKRNGLEGKVFTTFTVDKSGRIENVRLARGVHQSLDEESLRVIRESPNWSPGLQRGIKVRQKMTFPLIFKLN